MGRRSQRALLIVGILSAAVVVAALLTVLRTEPEKRPEVELAMLVEALELESVLAEITIRSQGTVMIEKQSV